MGEDLPRRLFLIEDIHAIVAGQGDGTFDFVVEEDEISRLLSCLYAKHPVQVKEAYIGSTFETVKVDVVGFFGIPTLVDKDSQHSRAELGHNRPLKELFSTSWCNKHGLEPFIG